MIFEVVSPRPITPKERGALSTLKLGIYPLETLCRNGHDVHTRFFFWDDGSKRTHLEVPTPAGLASWPRNPTLQRTPMPGSMAADVFFPSRLFLVLAFDLRQATAARAVTARRGRIPAVVFTPPSLRCTFTTGTNPALRGKSWSGA